MSEKSMLYIRYLFISPDACWLKKKSHCGIFNDKLSFFRSAGLRVTLSTGFVERDVL